MVAEEEGGRGTGVKGDRDRTGEGSESGWRKGGRWRSHSGEPEPEPEPGSWSIKKVSSGGEEGGEEDQWSSGSGGSPPHAGERQSVRRLRTLDRGSGIGGTGPEDGPTDLDRS